MVGIIGLWQKRGKHLKNIYAMFMALTDYRVSWSAKLAVGLVIAYTLLPIDIFPEYIPFVGLIDDLLIVALGISWAMKMVPEPVMEECLQKAEANSGKIKRIAVIVIGLLLLWLCVIIFSLVYLIQLFK